MHAFATGASCLAQHEARRRKYELSRRSLRVWPIAGDSPEAIRTNLTDFMKNALLYLDEDIEAAGIDNIERTKLPKSSNLHEEIKVTLIDADARDALAAKGRLLASYQDTEGRPLAGFRMDIPEYLGAEHKLLNDYGFRMKRIHGKDTRKYIKFDEPAFSLILELKLPGDSSWLPVSYTHLTLPTTPYV